MEATKKREMYQSDPVFRERVLANNSRWKRANAGETREYNRRYRLKNAEREAARKKAWREANPELQREYVRKSYHADPERAQRHRARRVPQTAESRDRWLAVNGEHAREVSLAYMKALRSVVDPRATNRYLPWTEAATAIALNPSLSTAEAALLLGRTISAITNHRHKVRRASV